jgi:type IV secretory pathway VirB10-like protein
MLTAYHPLPRERRYAGLALTVLVHAALLLGWQMSRHTLPVESGPEPKRTRIQWIELAPLKAPAPVQPPKPVQAPARAPAPVTPRAAASRPAAIPEAAPITPVPAAPAASASDTQANAPQAAPSEPAAATPSTAEILKRARRDIGKIDRALRKENNPYIAAPLDSPQIRMRDKMEAAHDLAAPRLWEAPKIEELVTNTGTGERRTRIITGAGTYCITERPPGSTSIDMVEKHGKQMVTSCPAHETPASKQNWRTLRD